MTKLRDVLQARLPMLLEHEHGRINFVSAEPDMDLVVKQVGLDYIAERELVNRVRQGLIRDERRRGA
jgi:hypothetical protein